MREQDTARKEGELSEREKCIIQKETALVQREKELHKLIKSEQMEKHDIKSKGEQLKQLEQELQIKESDISQREFSNKRTEEEIAKQKSELMIREELLTEKEKKIAEVVQKPKKVLRAFVLKTAETRDELVTAAKIKLQNQSREKNINLEFIDLKESKEADGKEKANFCVYFQALLPGRFGFDLTASTLKIMMPFSNNNVFHVFVHPKISELSSSLPELPTKDYPSGKSLNTLLAVRELHHIILDGNDPTKEKIFDSISNL